MVHFTDAKVDFDGFSVEEKHRTDAQQLLSRVAPTLRLFDGRWEQTVGFGYSWNERDTQSTFPSTVDGTLYAFDWQNELNFLPGHGVTVGLENEWEEADFTTFDDSRRTFSIYLQDRFAWGERFFGTLGFRFDDPSDYDSRVTYRVTAGVSIPEVHSVLRGSYGTGFKPPSLSQLNSLAFGGNPNLDPEESEGFDVGLETEVCEGRVVTSATFFYNDVDDLIIAAFDPDAASFLNFNIDRSKALGVETTLSVELLPFLHVSANYTYTRTKVVGTPAGFGIEDGSRLLRRPTHKANVEIVWQFLEGRGELSSSVLYIGNRRDLDPATFVAVTADDYLTVNLSGRFRVTNWLEVFARAENLFDEDYENVLGFSTAGISGFGGIRLRY
jgi:vitamin B12 transporter